MMAFLHKEVIKKHNISSSPLAFPNGKEALDFMISDSAANSFFVVLLDLNMPVMNGWEFLDGLERMEISSRTKVIIVTSSIDPADQKKAELYPTVHYYLAKPLLDLSPVQQVMKDLKKERENTAY